MGINSFSCKATPSYLIVRPNGPDNAKLILEHLLNSDTDFHTFCPPSSKPFRIVIRNLHHSTLISDISDALTELGHSVRHVSNIKKNKVSLPLFFVDLNPNKNNLDIFNTTTLLHTSVVIEKPHKSKIGPPQCHKCQAYGHTKSYCSHTPRCVKCGEEHLSDKCSKDISLPAKCALCAGAHTSSYKGCPVFKKLTTASQKQKVGRRLPTFSRPTKRMQSENPCSSNKTRTYADATANQQTPVETPIFNKIISDISNILFPLIKSLTTILNNLNSILPSP
uniref:Nucleic-acid-binding protein n=1 Tax=Schizaphis graminum TaxID=13262 RepID=A0A2S2NKY3_SCHGA